MRFEKKAVKLKDGTWCTLRSVDENDAKDMIEYLKTTSDETHFMIRYPEEINITIDKEIEIIRDNIDSDKDIMIAAFINDELIGNASIRCIMNNIKLRHRAEFGIAIKKKYWNRGIGKTLIEEVIMQARKIGYEQIELSMFSDNDKAQRIYDKMGFEVCGIVKNAYKLKDGSYYDEVIMVKKL